MQPHDFEIVWIQGHSGHEFNERCDKLAVMAANCADLLEDV